MSYMTPNWSPGRKTWKPQKLECERIANLLGWKVAKAKVGNFVLAFCDTGSEAGSKYECETWWIMLEVLKKHCKDNTIDLKGAK